MQAIVGMTLSAGPMMASMSYAFRILLMSSSPETFFPRASAALNSSVVDLSARAFSSRSYNG